VPIIGTDFLLVGARGGRLQNWDRLLKALARETGISGWSPHTLRRTTATIAGNLGAEPHLVSVVLGHKNIGGQLTASYSKSRYRQGHAAALQGVSDHLQMLELRNNPEVDSHHRISAA
jgi:integrase